MSKTVKDKAAEPSVEKHSDSTGTRGEGSWSVGGSLAMQLHNVQAAAGNRAATAVARRGTMVQRDGGGPGPDRRPSSHEPVMISATTYSQAATEAAALLEELRARNVKILVADGVEAVLFNADGSPIAGARTSFKQRTALPAGVSVGAAGLQRPVVRFANGRLGILREVTIPLPGAEGATPLGQLLESPDTLTRHTGSAEPLIVVPGGTGEQSAPAPAREPVPEFLRPENARTTANASAYPSTFQIVQPQTGMGAVNSTSTFRMNVDKAQGSNLLDQTTNVMQPMNFVWHVVKAESNTSTQVGRWAAQAAAFSRRVRNVSEDVEGNLEGQQHPVVRAVSAYNEQAMAGLRTSLALAGESVHMIARAFIGGGNPMVEEFMDVPWTEPGLFLVKCTATPITAEGAAVRRASSVAGALVFVADMESMARESLPSVPEERRAVQRQLAQLEREAGDLRRRQDQSGLTPEESDRLAALEPAIQDLRSRLGAVGDERATRNAEVAAIDRRIAFITRLGETATEAERAALPEMRERRQQLAGTLERADLRLGLERGRAVLMPAVRIDDATTSEQALQFAIHHTETGGQFRLSLADVTDSRGGLFESSGPSLAAAWQTAMRDMRDNLDRGRGWLRFRPPAPYDGLEAGVPNPAKLRVSRGEQVRETVEDTITAASVAALLAAPFTGGASLAVLIPLGVAGAAVSGYRLARRVEYGRFELDAEAVGDFINIASLGLGRVSQMRSVASNAGRLGLVFGQRGVAARLLQGGEYLAMSTQLWGQMSAPSTGDPREDQRRRLLAFLNAAQGVGLKAASHMWPQGSAPREAQPAGTGARGAGGPAAGGPGRSQSTTAPSAPAPGRPSTPRTGGGDAATPADGSPAPSRPPTPRTDTEGGGGGEPPSSTPGRPGGGGRQPTAQQLEAARQYRAEADRLEAWARGVDPAANQQRIREGRRPPDLGRRYRNRVDMTPEMALAEARRLREQAQDFADGRANPLEQLEPDATSQALGDLENAQPAQPRPELRQHYEEAVRSVSHEVTRRRINGEGAEAIARWAHAERRRIGQEFKDLTPPDRLAEIRQRNLDRYGDPLGPTIEYLRARGNTWEDIISSSLEPGGQDLPFTRGGQAGGPPPPPGTPGAPQAPPSKRGEGGGSPPGESPSPARPRSGSTGEADTAGPGRAAGPQRPTEPAGMPRLDSDASHIDRWLRDPTTSTSDVLRFWFAAGHWADALRYIARSVSDDGNARLQVARQELFDEARAHVRATVEGASIDLPGSARGARSDMDPIMRGPTTLRAVAAFRAGLEQALQRRGLPTRGWTDVFGINPYSDPRLSEFRIEGADPASVGARQQLATAEHEQLQIQHRDQLLRRDQTGGLWNEFVRSQLDHVGRTFGADPEPRRQLQAEFDRLERQARADEQARMRYAREIEPDRLGRLSDEALLQHLRSDAGGATSREARRRMLADAEAELQRRYDEASDPPTLEQRTRILEQTQRVKALEEEAYQPSAIESVVEGQQAGHQGPLERGEAARPLPEMGAAQRQNALIDSANMLEDHLPAAIHALERGVPVNQALDPIAKYLGRVLIEARELGVPVGQRNRVLGALARKLRARTGPELGAGGGPERRGATMTDAEAAEIVKQATELNLLQSDQTLRAEFLTETLALLRQLRLSVSTRRAMGPSMSESMRPPGQHPWRRPGSASEPAEAAPRPAP